MTTENTEERYKLPLLIVDCRVSVPRDLDWIDHARRTHRTFAWVRQDQLSLSWSEMGFDYASWTLDAVEDVV